MSHPDFETSPHYRQGLTLVEEMFGEQFRKGMEASANSGGFAADAAAIALESAFGAVWSRPGLERKQRSLVTIGILIGMGKPRELKNHIRAGVQNGLTALEIQEALIQSIPYAGFPALAEAIEATVEVLLELGVIDDSTKTAKDRGLL
ncbi:MAG: carboxymuconolactone decarboxylase family protein [Pseudomonadota bacterium]